MSVPAQLNIVTLGVGDLVRSVSSTIPDAVTATLAAAAAAGATILKPAMKMDWGGFSGYFADPDGYPWEVAHNPNFPVNADGTITIP